MMENQPPSSRRARTLPKAGITPESTKLASVLVVALVGSVLAHLSIDNNFADTGIYFVVIPGFLAILMTIAPTPAYRDGFGIFRGTVIAIFASALVVREGFICVVLASPLIFLIVGLFVCAKRRVVDSRVGAAVTLPLLFLLGGAEGTLYEFESQITVAETRTIDISTDDLVTSLSEPAELPEIEPLFFALPFPQPVNFSERGDLEVGAIREIEFSDGGTITLEVTQLEDSSITWSFTETTTSLGNWMTLYSATAHWTETPDGLELTVEIDFERQLAPAFYFDPLQRWGVGEFAEVLIDMIEHNASVIEMNADA